MKQLKANGQVFEVGCVWVNKHMWYRRVLDIIDDRLLNGTYKKFVEDAEKATSPSTLNFDERELEEQNAKVVRYKICGKDNNGEVVRAHDLVKVPGGQYEVLDSVESFNKDDKNFFIAKNNGNSGRWDWFRTNICTLFKRWEEEKQNKLYPIDLPIGVLRYPITAYLSKKDIEKIKKMEL